MLRCAARAQVGESVALPLKYYNNNLVATLNLLESMGRHGCKRVRAAPTASAASVAFLPRSARNRAHRAPPSRRVCACLAPPYWR